jgi:hypothetical protein
MKKTHTPFPFPHFVKLHTKKLDDPKMTRRKLKILELQNIETKNFKSSQQERRIPSPPPL